MKLVRISTLAFAASALALSAAHAQTVGGTLDVTAEIEAACSINDEDTLDFGVLDIGEINTASAEIGVTCTAGTSYSVSLNGGLSFDEDSDMPGGHANQMAYLGDHEDGPFISYGLYDGDVEPGNRIDPDDADNLASDVEADGSEDTYIVGGQVWAQATDGSLPAGSYSDTVTITVAFAEDD